MPGQKSLKELMVKYSEKHPQTLVKYSKIAIFSIEKTYFSPQPMENIPNSRAVIGLHSPSALSPRHQAFFAHILIAVGLARAVRP